MIHQSVLIWNQMSTDVSKMYPSKYNWNEFYHPLDEEMVTYYQRGNGAFTNFLRRQFLRLMPAMSSTMLRVGKDWVRDVAVEGQDPKTALKRRLVGTAQEVVNKGFEKIKEKMDQSGKGQLRKKMKSPTKAQKKIKRTNPSKKTPRTSEKNSKAKDIIKVEEDFLPGSSYTWERDEPLAKAPQMNHDFFDFIDPYHHTWMRHQLGARDLEDFDWK